MSSARGVPPPAPRSSRSPAPTDLPPSSAITVQGLRRLITASDRFRTATAAALGLNVTDTYALSNLNLIGPMTQTELARRVGITRGASTVMIDRLEKAGLAVRTAHPTDRRVSLVEMTDHARTILQASGRRLAAALPDVDVDEAQRIADLLETLARSLDELTENPSMGWPAAVRPATREDGSR